MKYIIKLNDKIISKRNTIRVYNYCWVRVVQKEETTYFYKNTGETISFKDTYPFTKQIVLNGQKVNPLCTINEYLMTMNQMLYLGDSMKNTLTRQKLLQNF